MYNVFQKLNSILKHWPHLFSTILKYIIEKVNSIFTDDIKSINYSHFLQLCKKNCFHLHN